MGGDLMDIATLFASFPPELPQPSDLAAALASFLVGEGIKRIPWKSDKARRWSRRLLPVLVPAVGAGIRVSVDAIVGGTDLRIAALRGLIAGGVAVYTHTTQKSVRGHDKEETQDSPPEPPAPSPRDESMPSDAGESA